MIASTINNQNQKTIGQTIKFSGIGLHSGKNSDVIISPNLENKGIVFIRNDIDKDNIIKANWKNVTATKLSTTITNKHGVSVSTIEHLMSALAGMHIDNALIYINGPEVPIMDGSSKPFVNLIKKSKIIEQNLKRKKIKVLREIEVSKSDSYVKLSPNKQFSINFEIEFDSPLINKQECRLQLLNGNYVSDVCSARTFGFEKDVNQLRENGFALGGTLENAVVVGDDKVLNKEGLRYKDEFVRHKILDSIGDLYLAGYPLEGFFYGKKSGHYLNNELLKKLFSNKNNYSLI
ncbi:MAG: UDP-3-O-acyl-N-acetylglucosamine deacetylase [Alphaproteobacteria bacterium MarineAlpha5_Bin9]|nr:MAG: UDP-3-O-acyl-N-acetylglucosamine deacetylase [Alphaproteobacteria bacterium MarineAlpha5_Bin9]|tara:strand:- start:6962 stop:7834 length:873 start_codon:yes stop_codon:yes gene_type:complete